MRRSITRRRFMHTTAATASLAAASSLAAKDAPKTGANERVRLGVIGFGKRGPQLVQHIHALGDQAEIVVLCDVRSDALEQGMKYVDKKYPTVGDFRRVLDDESIDAVVVATNGHWHVLPAIEACKAGKDVYLEKPVGTAINEGRAAINAARKYDRIIHMGTQQRSWDHYKQAVEIIRSGLIGEISMVHVWDVQNFYPGPGCPPDGDPPPTIDWDMWLGPSPKVPYNPNRVGSHYWFFDYGGAWQLDWAVHHYDIVHWAMGVTAPVEAWGAGRRYVLKDNLQWPDTFDGGCAYGPGPVARNGFMLNYTMRSVNADPIEGAFNGKVFHGSDASLALTRNGLHIRPEKCSWREIKVEEKHVQPIPQHIAAQKHMELFFDCIRTRKPSPTDIEKGHQASNPGHLMNIAWKVGRRVRWDADKEQIIDDKQANALVTKEYRRPWTLEV